jgi:hypothetical protein
LYTQANLSEIIVLSLSLSLSLFLSDDTKAREEKKRKGGNLPDIKDNSSLLKRLSI